LISPNTGTLAGAERRLRGAVAARLLTVRPLAAHIGAEVGGVDLAAAVAGRSHLDAPLAEAIRAALLVHKVLIFRRQPLSNEEHVAVARSFGELTIGHIALRRPQNAVPGHPEVFGLRREGVSLEDAEAKLAQMAQDYSKGTMPSTARDQAWKPSNAPLRGAEQGC
jgi:hypothetical protein